MAEALFSSSWRIVEPHGFGDHAGQARRPTTTEIFGIRPAHRVHAMADRKVNLPRRGITPAVVSPRRPVPPVRRNRPAAGCPPLRTGSAGPRWPGSPTSLQDCKAPARARCALRSDRMRPPQYGPVGIRSRGPLRPHRASASPPDEPSVQPTRLHTALAAAALNQRPAAVVGDVSSIAV